MEPTQDVKGHTVESLAVRWIMTPAKVRQLIASGQVMLGAEPFAHEAVLAFECTPHGKTIVLRAINIEADAVTQSYQQAAGYEARPKLKEHEITQAIDGTVIIKGERAEQ